MNRMTAKLKQQIPKLIRNEVKKLIRENADRYDEEALEITGKAVETAVQRTLGLPATFVLANKTKDKKLKYKITGIGKTARNILKGETVGNAVKKNIGIKVEYSIPFR